MNPLALILLHNLPRVTRTFVNSNHFHRSLGGSSYREYTVFQEEQLDEFLDYDIIKSFTDFDTLTPSGYTFTKCGDHIVYYQMGINELSVPEVTGCIRVDRDLHVKLFFKGSPLPLPQWFRYGRDCRLTRKSMLENFPTYIKSEGVQCSSLFEELRQLRF